MDQEKTVNNSNVFGDIVGESINDIIGIKDVIFDEIDLLKNEAIKAADFVTSGLLDSIKNKIQAVIAVLSTSLGGQLGSQFAAASKNVINPVIEESKENLDDFADQERQSLEGLAMNVSEDVFFPIVAPLRTLYSMFSVVQNMLVLAQGVTDRFASKVSQIEYYKNLITNTIDEINNQAENIIKKTENMAGSVTTTAISSIQNNAPKIPVTTGGSKKSIINYHKQGIIVGGRIQRSKEEFFNPSLSIIESKINKKQIKNNKTKQKLKQNKFVNKLIKLKNTTRKR